MVTMGAMLPGFHEGLVVLGAGLGRAHIAALHPLAVIGQGAPDADHQGGFQVETLGAQGILQVFQGILGHVVYQADGVLAQADQLGQQVAAQAFVPALLGADGTGLLKELIERVGQRVGFFLASKGSAAAWGLERHAGLYAPL